MLTLLSVPLIEVSVKFSVACAPPQVIDAPAPVPSRKKPKFAMFPVTKFEVNGPMGPLPHFAALNELPSQAKN